MAAVALATDIFSASAETKVVEDYYSTGLRARFRLDAARTPVQPDVKYADIGYDVNEEAFTRRAAARLAAGGLPTAVPEGWPTRLEGPLVWSAQDFNEGEEEYVYMLNEADKVEIEQALVFFKGTYTP